MSKSKLPLQNVCGAEKQVIKKEGLVKLLRWHFGYSDFRGKQLEAIQAVLSGRDCFCLMPTGGGKSMCYQIPALAKQGIVLVVSPLIGHDLILTAPFALFFCFQPLCQENQVMALKEKGIAAEYLSSTQTAKAKNEGTYELWLSMDLSSLAVLIMGSLLSIYEKLDSGKPSLRLLYVTPELIATAGFMAKLDKIHGRGLLSLIAIDEAHCVSTWGHDFRPSYRKLSSLRNHLPGIPVLALTATAVPKVQEDVMRSLCLRNPLVLKSSFNRPNIYYEVRYKDLLDDPYSDLCNYLKFYGNNCAIVYCLERSACDEMALHLSNNGISCAAYHAGLNSKLRSSVLDDWISSKTQVVVATVAFGMGIDRKDVRVVCHFNIPKSMESFYQESGRAGRDQLPSRSLLYYGVDDRRKMEFILGKAANKKLQHSSNSEEDTSKKSLVDFSQMVGYCEESGCRRKKILESFGEEVTSSLCAKSCDACKHPNVVSKNLEELTSATAFRHRNGSSQIYMSSASAFNDVEQFSEFWNRDDEASGSEEDISDSDDAVEIAKSVARKSKSSGHRISDRMESLQRAEENYYRTNNNQEKANKSDKKFISETLRESSKQRLLNALKQNQHRFSNLQVDLVTSAATLENECHKKYEKSGKSFYLSQMASTVRWLSTATPEQLHDRLGTTAKMSPEATGPASNLSSPSPSSFDPEITQVREEKATSSMKSASPVFTDTVAPPVLSFSEFVNRRKDNQISTSKRQSSDDGVTQGGEKKTKC
ncbi:hypothetical protein CASFOL_030835 [Castilleja foliolosa]|uniref:ATP-dependent DNA helicase n=1 Tax=Castilleja foliolosa TaxID=1961234 RepID=A0ABD3C7R8_9LAMI